MLKRRLWLTVILMSLSASCSTGNNPYLRDLKPAYECDAELHCTKVSTKEAVQIGVPYLKALLADLNACYREKKP